MKNKNIKRYKDDIRKTFIIYALIPVIIITFFSFFISFSILYRTVVKQNVNINAQVSKRIDSVVSSYMNKAYTMANNDKLTKYFFSKSVGSNVYEDLYAFVNSMDIKCNFFIFDENMNPIVDSNSNIPEYAYKKNILSFGIIGRMIEKPNEVILARVLSDNSLKETLTVGKAILKDGKIIGYITFNLVNKDLVRIISENFSITVVITDKYDNVISSTNDLMINIFGKIDKNIRDKSGFIKSINNGSYVTKSKILTGKIYIYTITSIGYIGSIFIIVGVVLILLFFMLTISIFLSASRIANNKTKIIDEIIEAMVNVQKGNLDSMLNINTNDEFQIIAESYNKMLIDIKQLIEINKEKAEQSILSEIKQLESQFNPHFLFNTLEMIKYMSKMEPESVNKIIVGLSTLLRYSINNTISQVTLDEDIEYTKNYLLIQKYRFGKRLDYTIKIDEATLSCIVPKLIIQPIIENAIKYGYENKKYLCVKINASIDQDNLVIIIKDNGSGIESGHLQEIKQIINGSKNNSSHVGLFNINRRVQLMYGEEYGVEVLSERQIGTVIKIILPVSRSDDDYAKSANS